MRLPLPIGALLVAVTAGAVAVAVWASVADAPWEGNEGSAKGSEGSATLLCEDALERRRATEDALQRPVLEDQIPLRTFRDSPIIRQRIRGVDSTNYEDTTFMDEVARLDSELRLIESDIQRFCE